MKYVFLTGCLLATVGNAQAQASRPGILDVNNYRGRVYPTTQLWRDLVSQPQAPYGIGLEIPKPTAPGQPSRQTMFTAGLWLGGMDAQSQLYVAAETYRQGSPRDVGFWTGPASQASTTVLSGNQVAYDSVWSVTRAEITLHRAQYAQPGYQMPRAIATWPGHVTGTTPIERLAPFADLNGNDRYEPALGEYPDVPGDQAMFFVCNDMAGIKVPFSPAMRVDIHVLVYAFAGSGFADPLANTAFIRYTIHNRSARAYQDVYVGHWADFDIGKYDDDYVGTDRARRMLYAYNGDAFDEDDLSAANPVYGYGTNPPTQGIMLLSDTLAASVCYNNDFSVNGIPTQAYNYYNYMHGKITTGVDLRYGGDGLSGTTGTAPYPWMYSGNPATGTGWTEGSVANQPGDRRGLISAGPYSLPVGGSKVFEIAYVFSQGAGGGSAPHLASVGALQQASSQILARYQGGTLAAPRALEKAATLALSPNPASRTATIHAALPAGTASATLTLRDGLGRAVRSVAIRAATTSLDLRGLPAGLYHATLTGADGRALASQRLVVTAGE
ncbi:MAG: T9SS type A sorting domain-containing protein [Hymenobacteraceae bacterium]|nr:T9SS type A sorting domain-containing protein [Hymenobacteraceae bacterium]